MGAPDDDFDAIWAEKKKTLRFSRGRNLRPDQILAYYGIELSKNDINDIESSKLMNSTILNASNNIVTTGSQKSTANSMMYSLLEAFKNETIATIRTELSKRSSNSQSIEETEKSRNLNSSNFENSKNNSSSEPVKTTALNSMAFSLLEAFKNDTVATVQTASQETEKSEFLNSSNLKDRSVSELQKSTATSNSMTFSLLEAFKNDTVATVKTVSSKRTSVSQSMAEIPEKSEYSSSKILEDEDKSASVSLEAFKDLSVNDPQKSTTALNSMTFSLLDAFKNDTIATPKSFTSKRSSGVSVMEESQKIVSKSLNFTSLDAFRDESMKTVVSETTEENIALETTPKADSHLNSFRDETMPTALGISVMSEAPENKTMNAGTQTSARSTPANMKPKTPPRSKSFNSSNSRLFGDNTESEPMEVDPTSESILQSRKSAVSVPSSSSVLSNPVPLKDSTHRSIEDTDERNPTTLPSGSSESVVAAGPGFKVPPLPINKLRLSVLSNRPHFMEPTQSSLARVSSPAFCPKTPPAPKNQSEELPKTPQFPRRSVAVPRIISEQTQGTHFHPNLDFNSPRFTAFRKSTALKTIADYETPPKSNKRTHAVTPSSATRGSQTSTIPEDEFGQDRFTQKSQALAKSNALSSLMQNYDTPSTARVPKKMSRGLTSCAREVIQEFSVASEVDRRQRREQVPSPVGTTKAFNADSTALSSLESSGQEDLTEAERRAKNATAKLPINNGIQNEAVSHFNLNYYSDEEEEIRPKGSGLNDSVYSLHSHTPARSGPCIALSVKKTGSPIIPDFEDLEEDEKENTIDPLQMTNVFDPPTEGESLPNAMIVKPQQAYVLNKRQLIQPEPQTVNDQALRRSSRTRLKPCRSWLNEQPVYQYGSDMTRTLVGVTEVEIKNKQYQKYLTASPVTLNDRRIAEQKRRKKQKEVRKRHWQEQRVEDGSQIDQSGDM